VVHDRPDRLDGRLTLRVFNDAGLVTESGDREISLEPHGALSLHAEELLGGFRDLNYAYRFAPQTHDVVAVELSGDDGATLARACQVVAGPARPRLPDLGLTATATIDGDGEWALTVATRLFAQYVAIDVPGFEPSASWFHLLPGESTTVRLGRSGGQERPSGAVRCLNGHPVRVEVQREP
jgi:beta-mannosidase